MISPFLRTPSPMPNQITVVHCTPKAVVLLLVGVLPELSRFLPLVSFCSALAIPAPSSNITRVCVRRNGVFESPTRVAMSRDITALQIPHQFVAQ